MGCEKVMDFVAGKNGRGLVPHLLRCDLWAASCFLRRNQPFGWMTLHEFIYIKTECFFLILEESLHAEKCD
jgi:hypothetical protein